ncbi:MAG: serine hydrolase [Tatlockia sp.]|nr:serine hydrolase [Tatlockia sp.]
MTVEQLCAASISYSDNTAMNLLVKKMGGLDQMTICCINYTIIDQ